MLYCPPEVTRAMSNDPLDLSLIAAIVRRWEPGARLIEARPLEGGVSAQTTCLEVETSAGEHQRLVLRRHGAWDLAQNPRIAATEYALLRALHARGLPVACPLTLDEACDLMPTPYILLEYLPGETLWEPADPAATAREIARQMAAIHTVRAGDPALPPLPGRLAACQRALAQPPEALDDSLSEAEIRAALTAHPMPPDRNAHVLLHDDLWPGNILWQDGAVCGILDWSEAALGDPIADLANSRLELLWAYGEAAMEAFTATYLSVTGYDVASLPWWDLIAALKPCGLLSTWVNDPIREAPMRVKHRWFTEQAIIGLAEGSHGWTGSTG
jgi:aminoglycoside phosphotransferase (APT) family kinase protein